MLIGSLNNPRNNVLTEAKWVLKNFDFLDLTLEMPKSHPGAIKIKPLKVIIDKSEKPVVGHTAWYLPIGSPFKEFRVYALSELEKCASVLEKLGASKMNVHFDSSVSILKDKYIIEFNIWTLKKLVSIGKKYSMEIMAENTPGLFSNPVVLQHVFRKVPGLLLHLDIAHANIATSHGTKRHSEANQTPDILKKLSNKMAHIHVSGNHGKHDEHLPIGKGNINWNAMLGAVKRVGYDSTISLEVFTSPKDRLADIPKLRKIWDNS